MENLSFNDFSVTVKSNWKYCFRQIIEGKE